MKTNIKNLRYVTTDGLEAPVDRSDPNCPFHGPGRTEHGRRVANSFIRKLRWETDGKSQEIAFQGAVIAALDPRSEQIVASVCCDDFPEPNNAIVIASNGSIDHEIQAPREAIRIMEALPGKAPISKSFPVESIVEVLIKDGRILLGLGFAHEWIERRYYDVLRRVWEERDTCFRQ